MNHEKEDWEGKGLKRETNVRDRSLVRLPTPAEPAGDAGLSVPAADDVLEAFPAEQLIKLH